MTLQHTSKPAKQSEVLFVSLFSYFNLFSNEKDSVLIHFIAPNLFSALKTNRLKCKGSIFYSS